VGGLFLITLLPVGIGLVLRARGLLSGAAIGRAHRLATGVFALIVLYTFVDQWPAMRDHFGSVGMACLTLNLATMTTGAVLARTVRLPPAGRIALAMECGMQNSALGITLAISLLGLPALAVPSVIYAFLMNITAFSLIAARQALRPAAAV
jgi:BASS family bile acid:Na+ symporter